MPKSFDFEVSLRGARPKVWRRFLLAYNASFYDLHHAIQVACGWWDYHLFVFRGHPTGVAMAGVPDDDGFDDEPPVAEARRVRLADYFGEGRTRAEYEYDFGDSWMHDVKLLGIVEHPEKQKRKLLGGARSFPHEDCGGFDAYERCVKFVLTGEDPWDEDDDDGLRTWLGGWHPDRFDFEAVRRKFDPRPSKAGGSVIMKAMPPSPYETQPLLSAWCETLGIEVPDLASVAARRTAYGPVTLAQLASVALLIHGRPMDDDALFARLNAAGISTRSGDLETSLQKSLASSRGPLMRDHQGRLTLDLKSDELGLMLSALELRPKRSTVAAVETPQRAEESGALTPEEVDAGYERGIPASETKARFVMAVLDAHGPSRFNAIVDRYAGFGGRRDRFSDADLRALSKRPDMIVEGDVLRLADDADLAVMRETLRKRARHVFESRRSAAHTANWRADFERKRREEREAALRLRRVVIAVSGSPDAPTRIECFDFAARERRIFDEDALGKLAEWVVNFDVVVGVRPHRTLGACGVDFNRFSRVVDLLPTKKTITIDRKPHPIEWDRIVSGTLGKLDRGVSELAVLAALYRCARLHGCLWMRVGRSHLVDVDVMSRVGGDSSLHDALTTAQSDGSLVAIAAGFHPEVLPANVTPMNAVFRGQIVAAVDGEILLIDEKYREVRMSLGSVSCFDLDGNADFAWRLPVLWRP